MIDRAEILPVSSGAIICKILCLDDLTVLKRYSRLKLKSNLDRGEEGAAVARAKIQSYPTKIIVNSNNGNNNYGNGNRPTSYTDNDNNDDYENDDEDHYQQAQQAHVPVNHSKFNTKPNTSPNSSSKEAIKPPLKKPSTVNNLLDTDDSPVTSSRSNSSKDTPPSKQSTSSPPPKIPSVKASPQSPAAILLVAGGPEQDMLNFEADSKAPKGGKGALDASVDSTGMSREELAARREAAVTEKVKEALEF
jgi:hypothetical protein